MAWKRRGSAGAGGQSGSGSQSDSGAVGTCKEIGRHPAEFEIYIRNNGEFIPTFGERYRNGETISTAFVESTINQVVSRRFVKRQSMQWTLRGAHLLLQTRTKVLNGELDELFRGWYPKFRPQPEEAKPQRKAA